MQPPKTKRNQFDYPDETKGSQIAAAVRKEANRLTTEQRRDLFQRAMVRIYGGQPKETTGAGH